MRAEYSYNDRGRGDHIVATWKLDADGVPIEYEGRGNDYMKAPVDEHFEMKNGRASWKNRSEKGDQAVSGQGVLPADQCAAGIPWPCSRALCSKRQTTNWRSSPPAKRALKRRCKANVATGKGKLTAYRVTGLGFTPQSIWLGSDGGSATAVDLVLGGLGSIRSGDGATANGSAENR